MNSQELAIVEAIEVFAHGYCFGRSLAYPHIASLVEDIWCLRDADRKNAADYRKEEWIAFNRPAAEVDRIARQHTRGRFFVCAVSRQMESDDALQDEYKRSGYRLLTTEPFFVHSLKRIPRVTFSKHAASAVQVLKVDSLELAASFAAYSQSRPLQSEHLGPNAPLRQYVAVSGDAIVGQVRSVHVGESTWVANMQVDEKHRRRGIGTLLLATMLRDDRKLSFRQSVLLATHTGAKLYPKLGYKQIGLMHIFAPPQYSTARAEPA